MIIATDGTSHLACAAVPAGDPWSDEEEDESKGDSDDEEESGGSDAGGSDDGSEQDSDEEEEEEKPPPRKRAPAKPASAKKPPAAGARRFAAAAQAGFGGAARKHRLPRVTLRGLRAQAVGARRAAPRPLRCRRGASARPRAATTRTRRRRTKWWSSPATKTMRAAAAAGVAPRPLNSARQRRRTRRTPRRRPRSRASRGVPPPRASPSTPKVSELARGLPGGAPVLFLLAGSAPSLAFAQRCIGAVARVCSRRRQVERRGGRGGRGLGRCGGGRGKRE